VEGRSDGDVEKLLAKHSEQPLDVDETMGIGKRAGDDIKLSQVELQRETGDQRDRKKEGETDRKPFHRDVACG